MSENNKSEIPKEHKSYDEIAKGMVNLVESGGNIKEAKELGKKSNLEDN